MPQSKRKPLARNPSTDQRAVAADDDPAFGAARVGDITIIDGFVGAASVGAAAVNAPAVGAPSVGASVDGTGPATAALGAAPLVVYPVNVSEG